MTIRLLPPDVAAKIAAGEVVERPANVAKELVENSLDAGATEIRVEIRQGGQRLLRVTDNGQGMLAEEVPLAFQRHATSKLQVAEDLDHIATFGFRGEALYSVSAVSQITLLTRHHEEEFGLQVRLNAGVIETQKRAGAPVGTVVTVENLFFNMPARKKFLRKPATETGRITGVVQHYALAYPDCRFSLVNEGRQVFQSTGSGNLFDVLAEVYGLENARQMVTVGTPPGADSGDDSDAELAQEVNFMGADALDTELPSMPSIVRVFGYTSRSILTRANRSNIDLFINRRYVEDRSLTFAVVQAYHTLLPGGRFPISALFIEVDPGQVDVNVHPQKTQVRFVDERRVFGAVQKAVRTAAVSGAPVPDMDMGEVSGGWRARRDAIIQAGQQPQLDMESLNRPQEVQAGPAPEWPTEVAAQTVSREEEPRATVERELEVAEHPAKLPPLRVVGQAGAMYIIAEGPEGLYLIDQHAAHERILYEKFMAEGFGTVEGVIARQQLLEPLTLHTGSELAGHVAQWIEQLNRVGYEVEPFGGDTFLVRAVPAVLAHEDPLRSLEEIVEALAARRNLVQETLEANLVLMVCKRAAIKAGQQLSELEMKELVRQLEECRSPRTCPHGRPTMIQLSAGELEKAFGRI